MLREREVPAVGVCKNLYARQLWLSTGGWLGSDDALTDGAVRFFEDTIDSKPGGELGLLQKLGCRNDGQIVNLK